MTVLRTLIEICPLLVMGAITAIFFHVPIGSVLIAMLASIVISVVIIVILFAVFEN